MKTKALFFLLTGCLLALAAWLVHMPNPAQADEIPQKYRETVSKGLEYLAKSQCKDGHWEGDGGKHPVAMTGLVGLALLMEKTPLTAHDMATGHDRNRKHTYLASIRKAVDWLMDQSQAKRDGLIFSEHPSETARYMEGHALATLFLAGVCEDDRSDRLTEVLTRAVKYIVKAQSTQGGWYHTSKVEGHDFDAISTTVIQLQALQAAEHVGIPVPREAINDAREYLKKAMGKYEKEAKPGQNLSRPADTAAALISRFSPPINAYSPEPKDEPCMKWYTYCATQIPMGRNIKFGRDDLTHYYYAQAVFNLGGTPWTDYRTAVFDRLQSSQNKDGSWPAALESEGSLGIGPVYSTAVWCTVLQLDKRSHPLMRIRITDITWRDGRELEPWQASRFAMKLVGDPAANS